MYVECRGAYVLKQAACPPQILVSYKVSCLPCIYSCLYECKVHFKPNLKVAGKNRATGTSQQLE